MPPENNVNRKNANSILNLTHLFRNKTKDLFLPSWILDQKWDISVTLKDAKVLQSWAIAPSATMTQYLAYHRYLKYSIDVCEHTIKPIFYVW
jgi:hypothetical protein